MPLPRYGASGQAPPAGRPQGRRRLLTVLAAVAVAAATGLAVLELHPSNAPEATFTNKASALDVARDKMTEALSRYQAAHKAHTGGGTAKIKSLKAEVASLKETFESLKTKSMTKNEATAQRKVDMAKRDVRAAHIPTAFADAATAPFIRRIMTVDGAPVEYESRQG